MKIAFVCNEYPPVPHGGIGSYVQTLGRAIVAAGHEVIVVGLGPKAGERDDHGVRVVTLAETRIRGWSWFWDRRRLHRWLGRAARAGEIELVDVPDYWGMMPWSFPDAPTVVRLALTETGIARLAGRKPRRSVAWCERRTLTRQRQWIAISQYALADTRLLFGPEPAPTPVIYCPVQELAVAPSDVPELPENFVLFVGRVSERKGAYLLAEAARQFLIARPGFHLIYVGRLETLAGMPADERIRTIVGPDLAPRVRCLGRLESPASVWACLQRASAFVFPSAQEYFGLVMAEAMLAGCPVVAGDSCAVREFIHRGETGLLVPWDNPAAIAAGVEQVLTDCALARRMAEAARTEVARRFDPATIVRENIEFFTGVRARFGVRRG